MMQALRPDIPTDRVAGCWSALMQDRLRPGWPQPSPHGRVYGVSCMRALQQSATSLVCGRLRLELLVCDA
jgi:hypothetical protein